MGVPVKTSEVREMRRLRATGLTFKEIGAMVGRHKSVAADHAGDVPVAGPVTPAERRRIRVLRSLGKKFSEISAVTGRPDYTCWHYAHDIKREPQSKRLAEKRREAQRIEALFSVCNRAIAETRA